MSSLLWHREKAGQKVRPFCHAKGEGHAGTDLARTAIVDAGAAHPEVDRDIVLDLPDRSNEGRAYSKQANIALVENLGNRPHDPVARTLDNRVEKIIRVLLPGERNLCIEMHCSPIPSLRDDPGKACPGAMLVIDPGQQNAEFGRNTGSGLLLQTALAQHAFEKEAVFNPACAGDTRAQSVRN